MRKLLILFLFSFLFIAVIPERAWSQQDSTCQVFGDGGNLNVAANATKRFYTKYTPGAIYGWSVVGSNAVIVGPRNLHYVDVQGLVAGTASLCLSYSVDGQQPCCVCSLITITGGPGGGTGGCCIQYVNVTYDRYAPGGPVLKIKFKDCNPNGSGIVKTKLFDRGVQIEEQDWVSPINPNYTYNHNIRNPNCEQIYCIKICGYDANGNLLCCTTVRGVGISCNWTFDPMQGQAFELPPGDRACSGGIGPPIDPDRTTGLKKLSLNPNPVSNSLFVKFPEKNDIHSLQIVDRNGNIVKTIAVKNHNSVTIATSDLKTGSYFIKTDDPLIESAAFLKQ